jgi:hypothetical protein
MGKLRDPRKRAEEKMRKRIVLWALLGALSLIWPGRSAAESTLPKGRTVMPGPSSDVARKAAVKSTPGTKLNIFKKTAEFLTTPIVKVAAFAGVRSGSETRPPNEIRRQQMYQERRQQHRDDLMKMRSPR